MADDYGYDSDGNPSTPKKTPNRAKERKIVRWTDEKLAICFADFRVACQKYRIDIKKPLEDAARRVEDFVTADALVQQLSKRRTRFYADKKAAEQAEKEQQERRATESARKKLAVKVTNASPASAKRGTPASQKRRKTALQVEVEQLNRGGSPSPPETGSLIVVQTPKSSSKRKPRGTATRARTNSIQKIKEEVDDEISAITKASPVDGDDSESEYCESPTKAKKKRVRGKRSATKKIQHYAEDEVEIETPRDDRFNIDATRTRSFDSVFVDEAGGENAVVKSKSGSSNDNSPEDAKYAGKHPSRTSSLNPHHGRRDSYQSQTISPQPGHAAQPNMVQMEDVEQGGMQHVNARLLNPNAPNFGMGYMSGYGDNPFMMQMQQNMQNMYGQAYISSMMNGQVPQVPMPDPDSDPSSQEHELGGLQDSFGAMASADNSFMYHSLDASPEMGQMASFDAFNPLQDNAHSNGHGHSFLHSPGFVEENDKPTPSKQLVGGLEVFNI